MRSDDPLVAAPVRERERMHRVTVDDPGGDPLAPGALRSEPLPVARDGDDGRMRNLVEWGVIIVIAVAFAFLVRGFAFQTFYIPSESMVPRLETDDRVLVNKLTYDLRDPARGGGGEGVAPGVVDVHSLHPLTSPGGRRHQLAI